MIINGDGGCNDYERVRGMGISFCLNIFIVIAFLGFGPRRTDGEDIEM